jgi:arsenite-transporting ATPase
VEGFTNLYCMEIDPTVESDEGPDLGGAAGGGMNMVSSFLKEFGNNIPGIDEAMSFAELMRHVQRLEFDVTVFDTAPTGHTLRLLSLPGMMEKALNSVLALRDRFGPLLGTMRGMMGGEGSGLPSEEMIVGKLDETKSESPSLGARERVHMRERTVVHGRRARLGGGPGCTRNDAERVLTGRLVS